MTLVVVQNAALATMGPVGFDIARRLGFGVKESLCLAAALLIAPATGYIALHEFHPEALSAPLLLLLFRARLLRSLTQHWVWFIAVLACKENMAPLLVAYCAVHAVTDRKRGLAEVRAWYLWPMGLALLWLALCTSLITPALNAGNVDYITLYDQLGSSASDILLNAHQRTAQDRRGTSPIVEPWEPGLGPAISLSLFATPWASMVAHRHADSSPASAFVAFIRVDDLFSLRSTFVAALLDGRRRGYRQSRSQGVASPSGSTCSSSFARRRDPHRANCSSGPPHSSLRRQRIGLRKRNIAPARMRLLPKFHQRPA